VPVTRRTLLGAATAATAATLAGCGEPARTAWVGNTQSGASEPPSGEASASAAPSASTSLPPSTGKQVLNAPYSTRLVDAMKRYLVPTPDNPKYPVHAGAVVLVAVNGTVTTHASIGHAVRYAHGPKDLPEGSRVAMRPDSIFDVASITKVITTLVALQQVDRGRIDLAAPVAEYLPAFDGPGKPAVTVSMLLTHTSGLPDPNLTKTLALPNAAARWADIVATPLVAGVAPGSLFRYSGTGLFLVQKIVEKVTGQPLDAVVKADLTGPLGLRDTGFNPLRWLSQADRNTRLVATDARSSRGLLRGVVHDQIAHSLGGVSGAAGLFTTTADLGVIGQMLLNGGQYGGKRLLAEDTVRKMASNLNAGVPATDRTHPGRSSTHGLGVEVDQPWFMGRLSSMQAYGHTGFTGTELIVDQRRELVLVLLTNRAHPNWTWGNPDLPRVAVANVLADALG
jgi:CubicO group peptidase (beta-lactamase class C family)